MKFITKYNLDVSKLNLGNYIGSGVDGEVYELGDKVIKLVLIKDEKKKALAAFNKNRILINNLIDSKQNLFVNVFDFKVLTQGADNNYYIIYSYIMERLEKLSEDEYKVIKTLISHDDFNIKKDLNY